MASDANGSFASAHEGLEKLIALFQPVPPAGRMHLEIFAKCMLPPLDWLSLHFAELSPDLPQWREGLLQVVREPRKFEPLQLNPGGRRGTGTHIEPLLQHRHYAAYVFEGETNHPGIVVLRALLVVALAKGDQAWSGDNNPGKVSNTLFLAEQIRFVLASNAHPETGGTIRSVLSNVTAEGLGPETLLERLGAIHAHPNAYVSKALSEDEQGRALLTITKLLSLLESILGLLLKEASARSGVRPGASPDRTARTSSKTSRSYHAHGRGVRIHVGPSVERSECVDVRGVAPADSHPTAAIQHVQLDEETLKNTPPHLTYRRERARAYHQAQMAVMDNQYLPTDWNALTSDEIRALYELVDGVKLRNPLAALVTDLVVCTATDADMLPEIALQTFDVVSRDESIRAILEVRSGVFLHRTPRPEQAYVPSEEDRPSLLDVTDWVALQLPKRAVELLQEACRPQYAFLDDLFVAHQQSPSDLIREIVTALREQFGEHITEHRLATCLDHRLLQLTGDPVASLYIVGDVYRDIPTSAYYTIVSREHLNRTYQDALVSMGYERVTPGITVDGWTGSRLVPRPEALKGYVEHLAHAAKEKLRRIKDLPSLVSAHNAFVMYTLRLLQFGTGHRDVNDPFERRSNFFPDDGFVIITDKVMDEGTAGRLALLPEMAILQLRNYLGHLQAVRNRLAMYCLGSPLLEAMRIMSSPHEANPLMPFLFLLREDGMDWQSIDPSTLAAHDRFWPLPGNAARHVLVSSLCRDGCPEEYRSAQLGHAGVGQQPYSSTSLLSPPDVRHCVAPMIDAILTEQGWAPLKGVRDLGAPARERRPSGSLQVRPFGAERREKTREKRGIQRRQVVDEECNKHWEDYRDKLKPLPEPANETVSSIEAALLAHGATLGPSLVNIFRAKLKVLGRRYHWAPRDRGHYFVAPPEQAGISYRDGASIHAVRQWRAALAWHVLDNPDTHPEKMDMDHLLCALLASLVLFDRLIDLRYLMDDVLSRLLAGAVRNDSVVWVDLQADNAPMRRVILHPMTTGLLGHVLARAAEIASSTMSLKQLPAFLHQLDRVRGYGQAEMGKPHHCFNLHELLEAVEAESRLVLPGAVAAYAAGQLDSSSLQEGSWLRLIENKRLVGAPGNDSRCNREYALKKTVADPRSLTLGQSDQALVTQEQWKVLRDELTCTLHQPARKQKSYLGSALKRLMSCSDPGSVFSLLLAWGQYLLNGERRLKVSSVVRYMKSNLYGLQLEANAIRLLEADELGLVACYEAVLNYSENHKRIYNAARLRDFHDFLVQKHNADALDFHDIEPRLGERTAVVDANIVTPDESEMLFKALDVDQPGISGVERVRINIQHSLYMDSGLRAREPFAVRDRDVQEHVIRLRSTAYLALKTSNARRVVPLSARTRAWIDMWLAHRANRPDYAEKHQLMNVIGRAPIRGGELPSWFRSGLYQVSGDRSLSLRNFRHASATVSMLCAAGLDHPARWGLGRIYRERRDSLFEVLNFRGPSRRLSFLVALQHGHGHPWTTFAHYVHGLDILLHERNQKGFNLSRHQAVRLFGVASENYVSKLLARAPDSRWPMASFIASGHARHIPGYKVQLEELPSRLDLAVARSPFVANFANIHSLLVLSRQGLDPEHLAETFDWPVDVVERLIARARSIELKTGYRPYRFGIRMGTGWPGQERIVPAGKSGINQHHQFLDRNLVQVIEARVMQVPPDPGVVRMLHLWEEGVWARGRALFFEKLEDTKDFLDRLEGVGFGRASIHAKISTSLQARDGFDALVSEYMNLLGLQLASRLHARVADSSGSAYPLGVALPPSKSAGQPALNVACFLALCVMMIQGAPEVGSTETQ